MFRNGRFAAEVMCLQTAVQFGDPTCAPRLGELESLVEGPRVELAARFAHAVRAGDAAELSSLSGDFEQIGDLVAAADAMAHAAFAASVLDLRGSALTCSTRAAAPAERWAASAPCSSSGFESLPLTDREREVVALLAAGKSTARSPSALRSVRTVESHIYRAMNKTGTGNREELVKLLSH